MPANRNRTSRNNAKLIADLRGKRRDRRAHYVAVMVLVRSADDPQPIIAEGEWHGEIIEDIRAAMAASATTRIFLVPDFEQRPPPNCRRSRKNRRSHRGQAWRNCSRA
jgi:XTP/dITP diphosphohydrolase